MKPIHTIDGLRDPATLARTLAFTENDHEFVIVLEFRDGDRLVHRSAHVILKEPSEIAAAIVGVGNVGG